MEMCRLTREGTAEPVWRYRMNVQARTQTGKILIFPVQLTTSRIGNLTRLIHALLYVMTIHTYIYIHTLATIYGMCHHTPVTIHAGAPIATTRVSFFLSFFFFCLLTLFPSIFGTISLSSAAGGVCVCVFFPFILDIKFVGRTSRGHTGGRSHRISHPPSSCGACLNFSREKDSAIPFPRRT